MSACAPTGQPLADQALNLPMERRSGTIEAFRPCVSVSRYHSGHASLCGELGELDGAGHGCLVDDDELAGQQPLSMLFFLQVL
jgi:hypothetical protein